MSALGGDLCLEHLHAALNPIFEKAGVNLKLRDSGYRSATVEFDVPSYINYEGEVYDYGIATFRIGLCSIDRGYAFVVDGLINDDSHPHVSGGFLCMGSHYNRIMDALDALNAGKLLALASNAACNYNPEGAYNLINSIVCDWCEDEVSDYYTCKFCGRVVCSDCINEYTMRCIACGKRCDYCQVIVQEEDIYVCEVCGHSVCENCSVVTQEERIDEDADEDAEAELCDIVLCEKCQRERSRAAQHEWESVHGPF